MNLDGVFLGTFRRFADKDELEIVKPQRTRSGYRFVVTPFIDGDGDRPR